jgi:hypothetical protein
VVKCSGVLQCSDGLSNKVSNIIRRLSEVLISVVKCSWVKCGEVQQSVAV